MTSRHELITPPSTEPFTLSVLLSALRIDPGELDEEAWAIGQAAREHIEEITGRAFCTQTRELRATEFPRCGRPIALPRAPVSAVTSFTYLDGNNVTQALVLDTDYVLKIAEDEPAQVVPIDSAWPWPSVSDDGRDRVFIRYTCGYGAGPDLVPAKIRTAILMLARTWFDTPGADLPLSISYLIRSFAITNV